MTPMAMMVSGDNDDGNGGILMVVGTAAANVGDNTIQYMHGQSHRYNRE